jgi:hypothetical protein
MPNPDHAGLALRQALLRAKRGVHIDPRAKNTISRTLSKLFLPNPYKPRNGREFRRHNLATAGGAYLPPRLERTDADPMPIRLPIPKRARMTPGSALFPRVGLAKRNFVMDILKEHLMLLPKCHE